MQEAPASSLKLFVRSSCQRDHTVKKDILMGRSRFKFFEQHYPYFVTSTINEGIPLFSDPLIAEILLASLEHLQKEQRVKLYGYVIMENHLHMVIESKEASIVLKSFKSFTAKMIIESLKERGRALYLKKLRFHKKAHKTQSEYQVWQEGCHPKQINSPSKMIACLEYIHNNPVKAGFVEDIRHWRYSSAKNYMNEAGIISVSLFEG